MRSYWWFDFANGGATQLLSTKGTIAISISRSAESGAKSWQLDSVSIAETSAAGVMLVSGGSFGFLLQWTQTSVSIQLPYWFPSLIMVAFAAAPWLPRNFSLRTLLIATTLIAIVSGLVVWVSS
jgi:hypothetical protein